MRIALAETRLSKQNRRVETRSWRVQRPCRFGTLLASFVSTLTFASDGARALPEATFDLADRFPFVVEVRLQNQLICSGTVLYPSLVVTAAHCLQQKVSWRGGTFYIRDYIDPSDLRINLVRGGTAVSYDVAGVSISPDWRASEGPPGDRLAHDVAVIETKQPLAVDLPPDLPLGKEFDAGTIPTRRGVLVAFGAGSCAPFGPCGEAGIRRYRAVTIERDADCRRTLGNSHLEENLGEISSASATIVWCLDAEVAPGDSGGALLIEGEQGQLYFCGVISAQKGPPEMVALSPVKQSVAAMLSANRSFIALEAARLGYPP